MCLSAGGKVRVIGNEMRVTQSPKHPEPSYVIVLVAFYPVMGAICLSQT